MWEELGELISVSGWSKKPLDKAAANEEPRRTLFGTLRFRGMRERRRRLFSTS